MRYLMIDHILYWEPDNTIVGVKNVAMSEDFFEFHFPRFPVMPGVMMLEALAQLTGWLHAISSNFREWFLMDRIIKCGFYGFVLPGDQLELKLTVSETPLEGRRVYSGLGTVRGKKKIVTDFQGRVLPLDELEDPEAQRHNFNVLAREIRF